MKKIAAILCAAALMTGCATQKKASDLSALAGEWNVTDIAGKAVQPKAGETIPFIGFDVEKNLTYGYAGCNRLTGALNAIASEGKLEFGAMGMTRMMCPDMDIEDSLMQALGKVKTYKFAKHGSRLLFCDADGNVVVTLNKK